MKRLGRWFNPAAARIANRAIDTNRSGREEDTALILIDPYDLGTNQAANAKLTPTSGRYGTSNR
jgi:tRNA nucleotidyltransferase (CCA-adding enzyme)